ncbi:WAT1-related protein At5g40240-like isoform X1 [Pyrus communis]|uniref:WAT1-related protein At5g40240-like isoform X1 n=1 Tax=Pyrus communis TaxID=23211 RepID=UPI0035BF3DE9
MVWQSRIWGAVPFTAMVIVECAEVGVSTLSKVAMSKGMSKFVFIVYYNAIGTLLLLPIFIFQRNRRAPLTFRLICQFFLLGLIGSAGKILFFAGVKNSSALLASAMGNLTPIFTFLLALIFRMEKLDLRKATSYAKSLGAIISVGGALVVTLYNGPALLNSSSSSGSSHSTHRSSVSQSSTWMFGGLLLAIQCLVASGWNIAQAATVKDYPEEMTIVFFYTMFLTIQCTVISLIVERNSMSAWKLELPIEIIAVVYAAICVSVFRISVHVWCLHKKGPVYVAMFSPLGIAIAAVLVVVFLGDTFYLGSLIGSIVISVGFYTVIYAKMKEKAMADDEGVQLSKPADDEGVQLSKPADDVGVQLSKPSSQIQMTPQLPSSISNEV